MEVHASRREEPGRWGRAVVIGGAYGGLVAARVLSDHFAEVAVLERDRVDADTGAHAHAPQGYHAHAMLAKGAQVLEQYFPGLRDELQDLGAPVFDYGEGTVFLLPDGYAPRCRTGVLIQTFTRDELERRLRQRVLALPGVRILSETRCDGLLMEPGSGRVRGVRYQAAEPAGEGDSGEAAQLEADLVVDASGRSSALDDWLRQAGVDVPERRVVKAKITYTTMIFPRGEDAGADYEVAYQMMFAPHIPEGGVILAVERGRWTCSLFGLDDRMPPTDDAGFERFAEALDNPRMSDQLGRRTAQEPVRRYTNVNNQWRPYHSCKQWPERLIALGDAVCVFNPIYGQGLTVAAMEADLLHRTLADRAARGRGLDGLSAGYQRGVARIVLAPWTLSSNSDLMWSTERRPLSARFAHWYNNRVLNVAVRDPAVWTSFAKVANMVAAPTALLRPSVLAKALTRGGKPAERTEAAAEASTTAAV
jgi:2-polyprenyl-6-methoxyphenol hydroxylase-like FAD-dependent oxidoreductase